VPQFSSGVFRTFHLPFNPDERSNEALMKQFLTTLACLVVLHGVLHAEPPQITDENVAFAYEVNSEIPSPTESLVKIISRDYRNAADEFTARELFEKIKPIVAKRLDAAKSVQTWIVLIGDSLAPYDFSKASFPTKISDTMFVPFDNGYAVMFTNAPEFQLLPVPVESAKAMAHKLQNNRTIELRVEGKPVGSKEKELNYSDRKVVLLEITGITIKLEDGTLVGSKVK